MKKIIATGVAIALSMNFLPSPAKANPALLAPVAGLCGTGVGCILVGTVVIGGILYYVYTHQGHKVYIPVHSSEQHRVESRGMSGVEAAQLGNSHWVNGTEKDCRKMGVKYGWDLKYVKEAVGGGVWCIFKGKQTDFSEDK